MRHAMPAVVLTNHVARWLVAAGLVVASAQLGVVIWSHLDILTTQKEVTELRNKIRNLRGTLEKAEVPPAYRQGALQALRISSFPLQPALSSLEEISIPGVQLTLLEVNLDEGVARAEVESASAQDLEKYLSRLANQDLGSKWTVLSIRENVGIPLPAGNPGPLPPSLLPNNATLTVSPPITTGGGHLVMEWRR